MGGQDWRCVVPYRGDINEALAEARQVAFAHGDYKKPWADIGGLEELGVLNAEESDRDQMLSEYGMTALRPLIADVGWDGLRQRLLELNAAPKLHSLEEVEALNCLSTDGTTSVLDMAGLMEAPTPGFVSAVTPDELKRFCGTDTPNRAQVEESDGFYDDIGRGEGRYVLLYQDEQPHEVLFIGYSYD